MFSNVWDHFFKFKYFPQYRTRFRIDFPTQQVRRRSASRRWELTLEFAGKTTTLNRFRLFAAYRPLVFVRIDSVPADSAAAVAEEQPSGAQDQVELEESVCIRCLP